MPAPDFVSERADEDTAQEAALRAYLLTPAGQAALLAGELSEFMDEADDGWINAYDDDVRKAENDGD